MNVLIKSIKRYYTNDKIAFIFGAMADKDIDLLAKQLFENGFKSSTVYTVRVKDNPRAATETQLSDIFLKNGFNAVPCASIKEAYLKAVSKDTVTVICGSLYLYKDVYEAGLINLIL